MTRGLNPPESLSAEDVHTLRAVRRDIYYQGIIGGGLGLCSGVVMYTGAQWARKLGLIKGSGLNRNTGMLTVLGSFAFGTFFMASTTGKELVHLLHPVFQAGWAEPEHDLILPRLDYETARNQRTPSPQQLREMRTLRRKTLMESLQQGRGISDSHSGRWVEEETDGDGVESIETKATGAVVDPQQLRELRLARRKSLMDSLQQGGRGISDSHSGRWIEENSENKFEKG